jgi:hypothetical protein
MTVLKLGKHLHNALDALMRLFYRLAYKVVTGVWFITRPTIRGVFVAVWYQTRILIVKNAYRKWYIVPISNPSRDVV